MYQFVVAVLVPLQTLLARMCGVASENLVLLQILIGQGSPSTYMLTASKTTLYVGALALRGDAILDRTVGHKLYFPMSACHVLNASRQLYHCHSPLLSPHIFFFRSCSMLCAYQCYAPPGPQVGI